MTSILKALALLVLVPVGAYILLMAGSGVWLAFTYHQPLAWRLPQGTGLVSLVAIDVLLGVVAVAVTAGARAARIPYWICFIVAMLLIAAGVERLVAAVAQQYGDAAPWSPVPDIRSTAIWTAISAPFALCASLFQWLLFRKPRPTAEASPAA